MMRRLLPGLSAILLLASFCPLPTAIAQQEGELARVKEHELEQVRTRIADLKKRMDRRAAERDRITADLERSEVAIGEKRLQLADLERQRNYSETRVAALDAEAGEKQKALEGELNQLAAQVRAAYMNSRHERIRLLLNQEDPASIGRLMAYYRYFSEYRGRNVDAVRRHLEELAELRDQAERERRRLAELAGVRELELGRLDEAQKERRQLLASLQAKLREEGAEIERLENEERDLTRLIAELTSILADYPITSDADFADLKGSLTWPVAGTLLHDFGQPRAGSLKWNGVVLAAPRGHEVRAVYHGRVVFADWLAGMGLLVIVDHGEGYMTLYGYNETLLKSAGDWVAPGDVIATVGESGGRQRPALYFELRSGRQPINPRSWFTRSPGAS